MKKKPIPLTTVQPAQPPAQPQVPAAPPVVQNNLQWFNELAKTVEPIKVVPPPPPIEPPPGIQGFPVRCTCSGITVMGGSLGSSYLGHPGQNRPKEDCPGCRGTGFVIIAKG